MSHATACCANIECGAAFQPSRKGNIYCSSACGYRVKRQRYHADAEVRAGRSAYQRQYQAENRDRYLELNRRWREANLEHHRALSRAWARANAERGRASNAAWRKANPGKHCLKEARRRANLRQAQSVEFTRDQLAARLAIFGSKCWMCGGPFEHLDHVKPISKGGPQMLANLRPACAPCNQSKGAKWYGPKTLSVFIRQ